MRRLTTLGLVLLAGLLLAACQEEPRRMSGAEFQTEYDLRHQQTIHVAEFLGERHGRVFLLKKTLSIANPKQWSEHVLFAEVTELDPAFLTQFRRAASGD